MSIGIEQVRALADPLKSYNFEVQFTGSIITSLINAEELSMRCTSTTVPGSSLDTITVSTQKHEVIYAGKRKYNHIWSVNLLEGNTAQVKKAIALWQDTIFNPLIGSGTPAAVYKATALVKVYDDANNLVLTRKLVGIFPTRDSDYRMDTKGNEAINNSVDFSLDYWI